MNEWIKILWLFLGCFVEDLCLIRSIPIHRFFQKKPFDERACIVKEVIIQTPYNSEYNAENLF